MCGGPATFESPTSPFPLLYVTSLISCSQLGFSHAVCMVQVTCCMFEAIHSLTLAHQSGLTAFCWRLVPYGSLTSLAAPLLTLVPTALAAWSASPRVLMPHGAHIQSALNICEGFLYENLLVHHVCRMEHSSAPTTAGEFHDC